MSVTIKSGLKPASEIKTRLGIQEKGPVHAYFTARCAKRMDKYVPFDKGFLAGTVIEGGEPTSNVTVDTITYTQRYASYQYYGMRKDGSHVINPTHRKRHMHSLATSYWDKKMTTIEMPIIEKEVELYIKTHGGVR